MAEFTGRDLHLVKKALAIAVLAIERQPGPFQSSSDQADMKTLLDALIDAPVKRSEAMVSSKSRFQAAAPVIDFSCNSASIRSSS